MTEEYKIQDFFNRYLGSPNDNNLSQSLIKSLSIEMLKGNIAVSEIVETLVNEIDAVKIYHQEFVHNHATPPPIIIAPETEEGKRLLKTIIEMRKEDEK